MRGGAHAREPRGQGRRQVENSGGGQKARYGERVARASTGGWGQSPQRGPGAEPLVRGSGGEAPL